MARPKSSQTLTSVISSAINNKEGFNLEAFKRSKNLNKNIGFKPQEWIELSPAWQKATGLPGIPKGHVVMARGLSDTGKSTTMIEAAVSAQKKGVLPVLIITELKFSWEYAKQMGFEFNENIDEKTGEINYDGFFIYVDRSSLNCVEDVAGFIADLLNEQAQGKLPYDLFISWDSVGSIPCRMSIEKNSHSNEWLAGAISQNFANFINQKFPLSRKTNYPYTNTFLIVNKVWTLKPETPMSQPKMMCKGGNALFFDSSLVITYGNITNSGTSKIKAVKDGLDWEFAKRTKVSIDKNHVTGTSTKSTIIMTPYGFIEDDPQSINEFKKKHSHEWAQMLGGEDFDIIEDKSDWEESKYISPGIEVEEES